MQVTKGHLTPGNKKAIKYLLSYGLKAGTIGRTTYRMKPHVNGWYVVEVSQMDRGLISCAGSTLRESTHTAFFKL